MQKRQSPPARVPLFESLETRTMLSVTPTTTTTIKVSTPAAELGQFVTISAAIHGSKHAGKFSGIVEFLDNGVPLQAAGTTLTVPMKHGKASYKFGPGNAALFTGTHQISAEFIASNSVLDSTSVADTVSIVEPALTTSSDGLGIATLGKGKGKPIRAGQEARMVYTGFLADNGLIFDYATGHGAGSLPYFKFEVEANPEQVITGFDEGSVGMRVGQTRVLDIPSALGYMDNAQGLIPANSELIFLITLQKITRP